MTACSESTKPGVVPLRSYIPHFTPQLSPVNVHGGAPRRFSSARVAVGRLVTAYWRPPIPWGAKWRT